VQNLTLSWQSSGALAVAAVAAGTVARARGRHGLGLALREVGTVLGLFAVWQFAGQLSVMSSDDAILRGQSVWDLERRLHFPSESTVQGWFLPHHFLIQAANYYYASMHFALMIVMLVWAFARHRDRYPWVRMTLILVTASSLAVQLVPVAPPRLLPWDGMVDTAVQYGQSVYGTTIAGLQADSYSAMPSVHVAWSVLVAVAVIRLSRNRWRWLVLGHPALTVLVVVVTANHFWLDGIAAIGLLLLSYAVQWAAPRLRDRLRSVASKSAAAFATAPTEAGRDTGREAPSPR
jgi:hypothetical protein